MLVWLAPALGAAGLAVAWLLHRRVCRWPAGEGAVAQRAADIRRGASVFLAQKYALLALFIVLVAIALSFALGWAAATAFAGGAVASALAGVVGMSTATRANVRTAIAARDRGRGAALSIAFFGGAVMGLAVASLGLLGLGRLFLLVEAGADGVGVLTSFGMGASFGALVARVEPAENVQQGGLAAGRGTQQDRQLAAVELEIDPVQCGDLHLADAIDLGQALDPEDDLGPGGGRVTCARAHGPSRSFAIGSFSMARAPRCLDLSRCPCSPPARGSSRAARAAAARARGSRRRPSPRS